MAQRVVNGDFKSAFEASKTQECAELEINYQVIQYHVDKISPAEAAARVAERARVLRIQAEAEAKSNSVKLIFVEKGGVAAAEDASAKVLKMFEREKKKLKEVINLAGEEAQTAFQAGLEAGAEEARRLLMDETKSKSSQVNVLQSEMKARGESMKRMERELASERAKSREAEVEARAAEARANAERARLDQSRKRAHAFEQRIADMTRASERVEQRVAEEPSDEVTWCAVEVEEFERQIGELTEQVRELKKMEREYVRNKSAVDNFKDTYALMG